MGAVESHRGLPTEDQRENSERRGDGVTRTVMIIDDGDGVMTVIMMRWCDEDSDDDDGDGGVMGTVMTTMMMVV